MSDLVADIRYALRTLWRNPGFAFIAVFTLGLGLGATTAIFSVVDGVLLRPLPYPEPERLVRVWHHNTRNDAPREQVSFETYTELVDGVAAVDAAVGVSPGWDFTIRAPGEPEHVEGYWVSSSFFQILGARPVVGRGFTPEEDTQGGEPVVVISHALWQRTFGGAADVIGRTIDVGAPATIVGVMPRGFRFGEVVHIWAPLAQNPLVARGRQVRWVDVVARLAPDVTLERARPDIAAFMARLGEAYPEQHGGLGATVESLHTATVGNVRTALWALLGAVTFVLLIACTNIGNLLLSRTSAREGELAVRRALGAGRARLVRQILTESLLLSVLGAAAGVVLAFWLLGIFRAVGPADLPRMDEIGIDLRVLGAATLAALVAAAVCGLAPAVTVARDDLHTPLKESGRLFAGPGARLRAGFVVSQIAIALVLLVGAGLLLRSFTTLMNVESGFDPAGVLTLQFGAPAASDPAERAAFYDRLFEDLEAIPGVTAAGGVTRLPLGSQLSTRLEIRGRDVPDGEHPDVEFRRASGGYFDAMGIAIVAGRTFDRRDRLDAPPVMIVSRTAAERFWPGEDPVGKFVRFWFVGITPDAPWIEIVGVTDDVRHFGLDVAAPPVVYVPFSQGPPSSPLLAVRAGGDPNAIAGAVRDRIRAIDRSIVIWDLQAMTARVDASVAGRRFNLMLVGLFGATALILAAVGIYGVIAYGVRRRSREIGLRMALGATRADVVRLVVRRGVRLTLIGLAAGLVASVALAQLIRGLLFGIAPTDPVTLAATTLLLAAVAVLASWLPSRRAVRVNPVDALRHE